MPLASGKVELLALGDFQATNESAEVLPVDADRGTELKFPLATRAVEARVDMGLERFTGYGERLQPNQLDVLLWPEGTCSMFRADGTQGYPGKGGGQALGLARGPGLLLAAGGNDAQVSDSFVGLLAFDVHTGKVATFDISQDAVLRQERAFATVSELGELLLIAGGHRPVSGVDELDLDVQASAELFDPKVGTLVGEPIPLRYARTRHAAVTLRSGATLLLGGRTRIGEKAHDHFQAELISPDTRLTKPTVLTGPRIDPRALLLSDGRVFLGGGTTSLGTPTDPAGEWISADGLELLGETDIPPRFERAFVATAGGGVLAVGGCENREPESDDDAAECSLDCARGCRPRQPDGSTGFDAYWLDDAGRASVVSLPDIMAGRPILLPGSDGRPWLVAELEGQRGTPRLFRFDPWQERFELSDVPEGLRLPRPERTQPVAIDPDAFVWIDDDDSRAELLGLRLGTRNRYARDPALVLNFDPEEPARPLHLAPDRPLREAERYDGKLWLYPRAGEPGVTVAVTDADYGDVSVSIRLARADEARDVPESVPPLLLLGDTVLGGEQCPWPEGEEVGGDFDLPRVLRRGAVAELQLHGGTRECSVPAGRLSLSLRASDDYSVIEQVDVRRGATAF